MIKKEYPYIDYQGNEHNDLVKVYSDLGVALLQVDTGKLYRYCVVDSVHSRHLYKELTQELGGLTDEDMKANLAIPKFLHKRTPKSK